MVNGWVNYILETVTMCIPCNWILDSSEYRTVWVSSIQMVKSCDLANHSKQDILDHKQAFFNPVFGPFDNRTKIYHSKQNSLVFRWLLFKILIWKRYRHKSVVKVPSVDFPERHQERLDSIQLKVETLIQRT